MKKQIQNLKRCFFSLYNFRQKNCCYDIMEKTYEELKNCVFQKKAISFQDSYLTLESAKQYIFKMKGIETSSFLTLVEEYVSTMKKLEKEVNNSCIEHFDTTVNLNRLTSQIEILKDLLSIRKKFLLETQVEVLLFEKTV